MKYRLITIENLKSKDRYNVIAKKVDTNEVVELKNIALPSFVKAGNIIRYCEHNFYDVIDSNGNYLYRN